MPSSTQNSTPTLEVDKKCLRNKYFMFYKIVISHSICGFKRHVLCKSIEKNGTHEGSKVLKKYWTHEGPSTKKEKMMGHEGSCKKERDSHVLEIKLMSEITHIKEYSIGLTLFYPHICTSWSKGTASFLLGSKIWLSKICRVSMPSYLSLPKNPYKLSRGWK